MDIEDNESSDVKNEEQKQFFKSISNKLYEAKEKFLELKEKADKNSDYENFIIMNEIIELVEINPEYNYEFLKLQKILNIPSKGNFSFKDNLDQLGPTLDNFKYKEITGKEQQNPALEIYNLLNLYLENPINFDEKTKKIEKYIYNIPLIESNERIRTNYYLGLFINYELLLDDKQKEFLKKKNAIAVTNEEEEAIKLLNEYTSMKKGIKKFNEIIPKMYDFFKNIELDSDNFNIKFYLFILFVTRVIDCINTETDKDIFIINLFKKEIDSKFDLNHSKGNIFSKKSVGIEKLYDNKDDNTYLIYNEYEKIEFNGENYIIENLKNDLNDHRLTPLKYILERNKSLNYFIETNKNFLDDEEIYPIFIDYFKKFIKSNCLREFLSKSKLYDKIIDLLNNEDVINNFLNNKHLKSAQIFDFALLGFTNKEILVSFIIGTPLLIKNFTVENFKEYENLKNIIFFFNVGMKFIILLHEFLIHLLYGYIYHLSEHKISYESPKGNKTDGGLYFEETFFGKEIIVVNLQQIITLINGEFLDSYNNFIENFNKIFKKVLIPKSELVKKIIEKYPIDFKLNKSQNIEGNMKASTGEMCMERNILRNFSCSSK